MPPKMVSQVARISCLGWAIEEVMENRNTISMRENLCIYVKFVGKDNKLLMILLLLCFNIRRGLHGLTRFFRECKHNEVRVIRVIRA